jgi:predicted ABC-type ATPase
VLLPTVYVIAGPNGAGKTTFACDYLPNEVGCFEFINADLIAAGLAPLQPERAQAKAARIVLSSLKELAAKQLDFGFETTLAGRTYARFIQQLKMTGYRVHLYYLWLPDVELHIKRVSERVRKGGHDVPETDIRRRYQRSLVNFFGLYQPLATTWSIVDNSRSTPRVVVQYNENTENVKDASYLMQMKSLYHEYIEQAGR